MRITGTGLKEDIMNIKVLKEKLDSILSCYTAERRERFLPFYLVVAEKKDDPLYEWSLYVVKYFVENVWLKMKDDETIWKVLKGLNEVSTAKKPEDRYPFKIPLSDFLKVVYDLRGEV